jgi:hypothetical protein
MRAMGAEAPRDSSMLHLGYRMAALHMFEKSYVENCANEAFMLLFLYEYMRECICIHQQEWTGRVYGPVEEKTRHGATLEALVAAGKGDVKSRRKEVCDAKTDERERLTTWRVMALYLISC